MGSHIIALDTHNSDIDVKVTVNGLESRKDCLSFLSSMKRQLLRVGAVTFQIANNPLNVESAKMRNEMDEFAISIDESDDVMLDLRASINVKHPKVQVMSVIVKDVD